MAKENVKKGKIERSLDSFRKSKVAAPLKQGREKARKHKEQIPIQKREAAPCTNAPPTNDETKEVYGGRSLRPLLQSSMRFRRNVVTSWPLSQAQKLWRNSKQ